MWFGKENVAVFLFWSTKTKNPATVFRRIEDHNEVRSTTGVDFVFDCSSQEPLRDFNAGAWTIPCSTWPSIKRPCIQIPQHSPFLCSSFLGGLRGLLFKTLLLPVVNLSNPPVVEHKEPGSLRPLREKKIQREEF